MELPTPPEPRKLRREMRKNPYDEKLKHKLPSYLWKWWSEIFISEGCDWPCFEHIFRWIVRERKVNEWVTATFFRSKIKWDELISDCKKNVNEDQFKNALRNHIEKRDKKDYDKDKT